MNRVFGIALALLAVAGFTPHATAQIGGGDVYGDVRDESGAVLPGAAVQLGGPFSRETSTSGDGQFRFLQLPADRYTLTVSMPSFSSVSRNIVVTTGQAVSLTFTLKVASVEETLIVSAEQPIVDTKRVGTETTITKAEATRVPSSRDPWAILRTIPGVFVDRVNIAGNESGQQSSFQAKGSHDEDATWNLDGVQIDDMSAAGASPTYFDYDVFEEVAVETGGNSLQTQTGGVGLHFVTKRGTNEFHGSVRGYLTHDDMQWSNIGGTPLATDPRLQLPDGSFAEKADHIEQISDYGFDLGGPVVKGKVFFYGSYGRQDIRLVRTNQTKDKTVLETFTGKMNWQASPSTMVSAFWFNGKKSKIGRASGALGLSEPASALWDQQNFYSDFIPGNIHGMLKLEVNHIFNPSFFLNVKYTNYDTGFGLGARGTGPSTMDFANGVVVGNAWLDISPIVRPLKNVTNVDGNYFFSGWGGQHELKFGFGYKEAPVSSITAYGGKDAGLLAWDFGGGASYVWVSRPAITELDGTFYNAFVGDTFTRDRLTVNVGARWDYQKAENLASTVPASAALPNALPALEYAGGGTGISWSNVSPRVGLTYALDQSRKTVVRASYALYAAKLDTSDVTIESPTGGSYFAYLWNDLNGDRLASADEIDLDSGIQYYGGVDPANPTSTSDPDRIDPDYEAPTDQEVILGIDRELRPELALSAAYTWRRATDARAWDTRIGMTTADYFSVGTETAGGYTVEGFAPDPAKVAAATSGFLRSNRRDAHTQFSGFEVQLLKRLSNRWMARVAFSYNDWTQHIDGPAAIQNPTRTDSDNTDDNIAPGISGTGLDGGIVAPRSSGSGKGDIWQNTTWSFVANGLFEVGYGFEVGAALYGREGFPQPLYIQTNLGADGNNRLLATPDLDAIRYDNLWNFDLRIAKNVPLGNANLMVEGTLFNVFNQNTILNRFRRVDSNSFDRLDEVMSPRVLRIGARLTF